MLVQQHDQQQALFLDAASVSPSFILSALVTDVLGSRHIHLCSGDRGEVREAIGDQLMGTCCGVPDTALVLGPDNLSSTPGSAW